MLRPRLRFGIFMAPFHPVAENPTLCLERDRELIKWLDELGFDEAWIGEHHSAGYEIIASPELFIADVAARTQRIRLGTGVVSLPYHHPLMVADRMMQLDHLTRGRAMFGVGPGLLSSDAMMLGINPSQQRDMMVQALEVIIPLLRGEVVTRKTDWFELRDAKLQLAPYSRPHLELAVAASVTPSGPRTAGRWGMSMLSPAATTSGGFNALAYHWGLCEETAREHGQTVDRTTWRLAAPVHVAETREQARADLRFGLAGWLHYFQKVVALPGVPEVGTPDECLDAMLAAGFVTVGTPDDLIAQIERLEEQSGGFGAFLVTAHEWANREATRRSYELIARYVMPRFQDSNAYTRRSMEWVAENRSQFMGAAAQGIMDAVQKDAAERERLERERKAS
ncbi:MAG: LLM class flavin-dependent oxidoreductase [Candidatus Binatia bacterium]